MTRDCRCRVAPSYGRHVCCTVLEMRRLVRGLFTLGSAFSLLLGVGVCGLWLRSYFTGDEWRWGVETVPGADNVALHRSWMVSTSRGGIWFRRSMGWTTYDPRRPERAESVNEWEHVRSPAEAYPVVPPFRATGRADLTWTGRTLVDRFGFGLQQSWFTWNSYPPHRRHMVVVLMPIWSVTTLLLIAPLAWTVQYRWRRTREGRQREGRCQRCGYDLRFSPAGCPECGPPRMTRRERQALLHAIDDSAFQDLREGE